MPRTPEITVKQRIANLDEAAWRVNPWERDTGKILADCRELNRVAQALLRTAQGSKPR